MFKFEVGKVYKTKIGHSVLVLSRTGCDGSEPAGYECLVCSDGKHRYDRSTNNSDAGRVTGTKHDYSCPDNFARLDKP